MPKIQAKLGLATHQLSFPKVKRERARLLSRGWLGLSLALLSVLNFNLYGDAKTLASGDKAGDQASANSVIIDIDEDTSTPEPAANTELGNLEQEHADKSGLTWWHCPGVNIGEGKKSKQPIVAGEGRVLLKTTRPLKSLKLGNLVISTKGSSVLFLDRVGKQVRLMVLDGHATAIDGQRRIELPTSYQVVSAPLKTKQTFIDDGVVRRPIEYSYDTNGYQTSVRQFYLEQVVYVDPILRTLYKRGGDEKRLIEKLNKTGAILRDLNGSGNYHENQV